MWLRMVARTACRGATAWSRRESGVVVEPDEHIRRADVYLDVEREFAAALARD
jgi:hypothetical protein